MIRILVLLMLASTSALGAQFAGAPVSDIGAKTNERLQHLSGCETVSLPPGRQIQITPIVLSGTCVHLVGAPQGTLLEFDRSRIRTLVSTSTSDGWSASNATVSTLASDGEDHPTVIEGGAYLQLATGPQVHGSAHKPIPPVDLTHVEKIGLFVSSNQTRSDHIQLFVSDGVNTTFWSLDTPTLYGTWKYVELARNTPAGSDGKAANQAAIKEIGFRSLERDTKYYFSSIYVYDRIPSSIVLSNCTGCSVDNVTVESAPIGTNAVVAIDGRSSENSLVRVSTTGGAYGIYFGGSAHDNVCTECRVTGANIAGFRFNDGTAFNTLVKPQATKSAFGIHIRPGAHHNRINNASVSTTFNQGVLIEGHDNTIEGVAIDRDRLFGLFLTGSDARSNRIKGVRVTSVFGESCVQISDGASYNSLTDLDLKTCGGSGLDLDGTASPVVGNIIDRLLIANTGASGYHGGERGSVEGRGIVLNAATDNLITDARVEDVGRSRAIRCASSCLEGVIINNGSRNNTIRHLVVSNATDEGIAIYKALGNTLADVKLIGNGRSNGKPGVFLAIEATGTTLVGDCYSDNGGGAIKDNSAEHALLHQKSSSPAQPCTAPPSGASANPL